MSAVGDARKRLAQAEAQFRDADVRLDEQRKRGRGEANHHAMQEVQRLRADLAIEKEAHAISIAKGKQRGDEWKAAADEWRERARRATATIAAVLAFADELDAGASLRWTSTVAKELRARVEGAG